MDIFDFRVCVTYVTHYHLFPGVLSELQTTFLYPQGGNKHDAGDVRVEWEIQGNAFSISQFNVTYRCEKDGETRKKVISSEQRSCIIPFTVQK